MAKTIDKDKLETTREDFEGLLKRACGKKASKSTVGKASKSSPKSSKT